MPNKELIKKKINKIGVYADELRPILNLKPNDILGDYMKLRTVERNFQLIVDTIIDINTHIISTENLPAPEDATETFHILGRAGILPAEFAAKFSPVAGLRNKVVHDYDDIDAGKLINDIKDGIDQFGEYAVYIDNFMNQKRAEKYLE
ncbi:MAG: hypothetical protein A3J63_02160 [Candidatus Moranbacteria bacterium RIFCSPHIGHO2_02_FULL_40_12b]|nr:MAG: hypothetical protein A3J63_02160 [Candidatus Moranbacteria bacterium RIFCSPHIGHO2_02_FULL_40_12b]OGI23613.1 MAG: hypothetical protein A3E91_01505 [Candidatus Moranbacteria bacterium RIFCSPHIGHO2_12_FULL_40_10]